MSSWYLTAARATPLRSRSAPRGDAAPSIKPKPDGHFNDPLDNPHRGYSTIFWPEFVEFERYVLRAGFSMEGLRGFEQQCGGDRRRIEAVMNHRHIADIQYHGCEDITRERVVYLGRVLSEIYRAKLAWQFPSKRFEVHFDDSPTEHLTDHELTFVQI